MSGITREVSITGLFSSSQCKMSDVYIKLLPFPIIYYPLTRQSDLKGDVCKFVDLFQNLLHISAWYAETTISKPFVFQFPWKL